MFVGEPEDKGLKSLIFSLILSLFPTSSTLPPPSSYSSYSSSSSSSTLPLSSSKPGKI